MNQYQFLQVTRRMEEKYGKMKKNEEDKYAMLRKRPIVRTL